MMLSVSDSQFGMNGQNMKVDDHHNNPGTGMLTCVPPFLSQGLVVHTLKNYIKVFQKIIFSIFLILSDWPFTPRYHVSFTITKISTLMIIDRWPLCSFEPYLKGFLTMFIGIPYLTMCATRTEMTQVLKKGKIQENECPQNMCNKQLNAIYLFADGRNGSHGLWGETVWKYGKPRWINVDVDCRSS